MSADERMKSFIRKDIPLNFRSLKMYTCPQLLRSETETIEMKRKMVHIEKNEKRIRIWNAIKKNVKLHISVFFSYFRLLCYLFHFLLQFFSLIQQSFSQSFPIQYWILTYFCVLLMLFFNFKNLLLQKLQSIFKRLDFLNEAKSFWIILIIDPSPLSNI